MSPALIAVCVTGALLGALLVFFYMERRRGVRTAAVLREDLDGRSERFFGMTLKAVWHYMMHHVWYAFLRTVRNLEQWLAGKMRQNRAQAIEVNQKKIEHVENSAFKAVAEHKQAVALSDEERQRRKDEALEG